MSVRPSVCEHDKSKTPNPIDLKFSPYRRRTIIMKRLKCSRFLILKTRKCTQQKVYVQFL